MPEVTLAAVVTAILDKDLSALREVFMAFADAKSVPLPSYDIVIRHSLFRELSYALLGDHTLLSPRQCSALDLPAASTFDTAARRFLNI